MPSAARLVALNNLDASKIVGTGLGGRIMRYDVVDFMEGKQSVKPVKKSAKRPVASPTPATTQKVAFVDEPVSQEKKPQIDFDEQVKKVIPHSYLTGEFTMTKLVPFFTRLQKLANTELTTMDIAVKAACLSLQREKNLSSVSINVCQSNGDEGCKTFMIPNVDKKNLLDIHQAIEEGAKSASSPLQGDLTVYDIGDVISAGGILSCANEFGTITIGKPYRTYVVSDDDEQTVKACKKSKLNFAYNALKLDEVSGNAVLATFSKLMENPEFLME